MAEYIDIDYPLLFKDIRNREIRVTVRDLLKANHTGCVLADVAPVRHGRWVDTEPNKRDCDYRKNGMAYYCSCCLHRAGKEKHKTYKYCPWCGAKMEKEMKPDGV